MIPVVPHFDDDLNVENLERAIIQAEWHDRESLEEFRVIPYGIPNEVYRAMLKQQFYPIGGLNQCSF